MSHLEQETTFEQKEQGPKTPNKPITLIEPNAPYKKKLRCYGKTKKMRDDHVANIMLFDTAKKNFRKFRVFLDDDVGIDYDSQNKLINSEMDDDCQSSNEVISDGIKKGIEYLKQAITKKK